MFVRLNRHYPTVNLNLTHFMVGKLAHHLPNIVIISKSIFISNKTLSFRFVTISNSPIADKTLMVTVDRYSHGVQVP